ncbi:MAG: ribonuclease P protein component [Pusillimonas sp.]
MRATFTPAARLHRPSEYASALQGKRVARGALLVVSTPRNVVANPDGARLGMIIAKRFAAKAVTRNAIKRVIREAFRLKRHQLPPKDFVFRLHSKVAPASLTELKQKVRAEADALLERSAKC